MTLEDQIDRFAEAAKEEIAMMTAKAREAMNQHFAFINRSLAQRRRFARARQLKERTL
jgi:hypothetical protein